MGNAPSSVPFGAQLNLIHIALSCHPVNSNSVSDFEFKLSLTAPLSGGSGQQIYYSDIYPEITLPKFIDSSKFAANVTIDFLLDNAASSDVRVSGPATVTGAQQTVGLIAGPVTLGEAGKQHNYALGEVTIALGDTTSAIPATNYVCPAPSTPALIGSTSVDSSSGSALAPSTGSRDGLPPTPIGSKATVANLPQYCIFNGGNYNFNLTVGGVSPVLLSSGQVFNITEFTSFITLPPEVVEILNGFYGGEQTIDGFTLGIDPNFNRAGVGFGLSTTNASPSNKDLAYDFTATDPNTTKAPLGGNRKVENANPNPVIIALPLDGSLNIGSFTAGPSASIFSANITEFSGQAGAYSVTYRAPLGPFAMDCNTTISNYLFTAAIV